MSVASLDQHMALRAVTNGKTPAMLHDALFVGRGTELALFERDLELIEAGGASFRILVGEPGSGKTMLMHAMADRARSRRFVTAGADLDPDCLLHGRGGEGRALLRKALLGMRTAASGDDPAIDSILGRFGNDCRSEAQSAGQLLRDHILSKLTELHRHPKGAEFARVIQTFALASENSVPATNARRWLCGDYSTLSDARDDLGAASIVEDKDFWPMQKLWGSFVRQAGRAGYLLFLDEARILCDLDNPHARKLNFEQLLMILNDLLQGRARGIGVVIAATPAFVSEWKGLAKHEGLSSCLRHQMDQVDLHADSQNVLVHLQDLGDGEVLELLQRCRMLYASCHPEGRLLPEDAIETFLETCRNQIGAARWHVPRLVLQRFIALQGRLLANPTKDWRELLSRQDSESANSNTEFEGYALRQM